MFRARDTHRKVALASPSIVSTITRDGRSERTLDIRAQAGWNFKETLAILGSVRQKPRERGHKVVEKGGRRREGGKEARRQTNESGRETLRLV